MSISAVDEDLAKLITRQEWREMLNTTSESFQAMSGFIDNLSNDLTEIGKYEAELGAQAELGYDVGSSRTTLSFQKNALQGDLTFFLKMREIYQRRCFSDMWQFAKDIAMSAAMIETRGPGQTVEQLRDAKMQQARRFEEDGIYTMQDSYNILSVCESLLLELAGDISAFGPKISEAEKRQARGFQVGSLCTQLKNQQMRLRTDFVSSVEMLKQFLAGNARFAQRALGRIKLISQEIVTSEEAAAAGDAAEGSEAAE